MFKFPCSVSLTAACILSLTGSPLASAVVTMETVRVGDAGNAPDTRIMTDHTTGYGQVNYVYNIGKYEVTAGQYTAFLNAVAQTDTYNLYNPKMVLTDIGCGIAQLGTAGRYSYAVGPDFVNRPVTYVNFWDACRFVNWLQNGQPAGSQGPGTTETGTYTLSAAGIAANSITRNTAATWAIASEDEWYKAAYYSSQSESYYLYPTMSDTLPGRDLSDPFGNNANHYANYGSYPILPDMCTTLVGEFQNSPSPYGTFDQGGNAWEWNEGLLHNGSYRGLRGGSYSCYESNSLQSDFRYCCYPDDDYDAIGFGFRVVQVPEPASLGILAVAAMGILLRRKRAYR